MRPTVVKVGGSFARYPRLADLTSALATGGGRVVVVPGGGPFADRVRAEQARIGFDNAAAHRMALLAMVQFGYALSSLADGLRPTASAAATERALAAGSVPVWLPLDLLDGRAEVPESWELTSDSLAVWLARRIGAGRIIYLKRGRPPRSAAVAELVAAGVLDPLVPRFLSEAGIEAWLCGPRQLAGLGDALAASAPIGRRIEVA